MNSEATGAAALSHFEAADLLDGLSTGVLVLDQHLCVIYANVGAQSLLAIGLNQARGRPITELFAQPGRLAVTLKRALERSEVCAEHELALLPIAPLHGPRPPVVVDITATPLESDLTGTHLLLELADATQRQRITRESEQHSRLEGSRLMVRQLAHEIKNPLGGLRGAAQLLERELPAEALREYTTIIINEADRLRTLVDTMLGPSTAPRKQRLNLHEVCEHVYQLLRGDAAAGVSIERDYDPSLPEGQFDRDELIQALLNVARNALQAVGERGRVVIRTRSLGQHTIGTRRYRLVVSLQVEDDGPGVPDELQHTLFLPLVTGKPDGSGLGLTVAQAMVGRHGGTVEFDSRPGQTIFSLLIPVEDKA